MGNRCHHGLTAPELLIVLSIVALVIGALFSIGLQTARVYAARSKQLEPQAAQTLALSRMELELREAIEITRAEATHITFVLPAKNTDGLNQITVDDETQAVSLNADESAPVHYFLGADGNATPDASGDTLYRAVGDPVNESYPDATVLISGTACVPYVSDPEDPGSYVQTTIFAYSLSNRFVTITLSTPITERTSSGMLTTHHSTSTQFLLRNMERLP